MSSSPFLSRNKGKTAFVSSHARYESDAAVAQYCDAHYGPDKFGVANFPARLAHLCVTALSEQPMRHALDLGCAVGRASFELATHFDHVIGLDISARFIAIADRLKNRGKISYHLPEEGDLVSDHQVSLADLGLASTSQKISFYQGDALRLEAPLYDFDLILAANLIDRLADPGAFLSRIHQRLVIGGLLAVASPYSWLEVFTPRQQWLGGRFRAGSPLTTLEGLGEKLAKHFIAVNDPQEVEFVIREKARKFQHYVAELTLWRRVS